MRVPLERIRRFLAHALRALGFRDGEVSVAFLGDDEMSALHERWLGKPRPTDVLSFALQDPGDAPFFDIYVGYEQVLRQALEAGAPRSAELARVALHGVLHAAGYDHGDRFEASDPASREMHGVQEALMREWPSGAEGAPADDCPGPNASETGR